MHTITYSLIYSKAVNMLSKRKYCTLGMHTPLFALVLYVHKHLYRLYAKSHHVQVVLQRGKHVQKYKHTDSRADANCPWFHNHTKSSTRLSLTAEIRATPMECV